MSVRIIDVNTSKWQNVTDIYEDIIEQIGAPDWHGRNINSLVDSIIYGGINALESSYIIRFHETSKLSGDMMHEIIFIKQAIEDARHEKRNETGIDVNVGFEIF